MGKIFYVMGKSASGKDTIYKKLHSRMPELKTVTMYTTRPIRDGEHNGVEYFFVDPSYLDQCRKDGILIECRTWGLTVGDECILKVKSMDMERVYECPKSFS